MNRINKKMRELQSKNQVALITYITAGDPSIEQTEQLIYAKERGGADIIEIGIPHSDPVADGPIIQEAVQRALKAGTRTEDVFECIKKVRQNSQVPIAILAYYNMIFTYGIQEFIEKCDTIGVDGLIIPDLPLEEREEVSPFLKGKDIALIPLVAPTSKTRIKAITDQAGGFVYCVSSLGVTGERSEFHKEVEIFLKEVRQSTNLPIAVGFGISRKEDIIRFKKSVDGIIIGSAIVKQIHQCGANGLETEKIVAGFSTK